LLCLISKESESNGSRCPEGEGSRIGDIRVYQRVTHIQQDRFRSGTPRDRHGRFSVEDEVVPRSSIVKLQVERNHHIDGEGVSEGEGDGDGLAAGEGGGRSRVGYLSLGGIARAVDGHAIETVGSGLGAGIGIVGELSSAAPQIVVAGAAVAGKVHGESAVEQAAIVYKHRTGTCVVGDGDRSEGVKDGALVQKDTGAPDAVLCRVAANGQEGVGIQHGLVKIQGGDGGVGGVGGGQQP